MFNNELSFMMISSPVLFQICFNDMIDFSDGGASFTDLHSNSSGFKSKVVECF